MKFLVLVKHVPDSGEPRQLSLETGLLERPATEHVPDEINERALECALRLKDTDSSHEVVVLSVGPAEAEKTVRKMLSMGADRGVHIVDESMIGADMVQTAKALAVAVKDEGFDVLLTGNQSTDGRGGLMSSMLAEMLDMPVMPDLDRFEVDGDKVLGTISTETSHLEVEAATPLVASVTERAAEARFPTFKGIMAAKKKPVATKSLADLDVQAGPAYAPVRSVMVSAEVAPPKASGIKVIDDGTAAAQLADFLDSKQLLKK